MRCMVIDSALQCVISACKAVKSRPLIYLRTAADPNRFTAHMKTIDGFRPPSKDGLHVVEGAFLHL